MENTYIQFKIPGRAVAKQSFRMTRNGFGYTPSDVKAYANWVRLCFCESHPKHLPSYFYEQPLRVIINSFIIPPKSWSKKRQEQALDGFLFPTVKPDCDNISKNICDALNGIAYPDDKQIVSLEVNKKYSDNEFVEVVIRSV